MFGLGHSKGYYKSPKKIVYYSERYEKYITVAEGYPSDGATGAIDVCPKAWFVHDKLCDFGHFDDGSLCNNWQASQILTDILKEEGFWFRQYTWLWATWLIGGGKARKNGMF